MTTKFAAVFTLMLLSAVANEHINRVYAIFTSQLEGGATPNCDEYKKAISCGASIPGGYCSLSYPDYGPAPEGKKNNALQSSQTYKACGAIGCNNYNVSYNKSQTCTPN
jgi:hypothetical protein